jgi:hypothetical protein
MLTAIFCVIFFVCVAMMWNEGMWSNSITFVNVVFAAMLATNYYEPVADWIEGEAPSYTYMWDFLSVWLLFVFGYTILRLVTDRTSLVRVRFKMPVEHTGRILFAALTSWVFICFACMTLHMAPLARTAFRGSFQSQPDSKNLNLGLISLAPDRVWLGFMQSRSQGALSTPDDTATSSYPQDEGKRVFDPRGEFIFKYGTRRDNLHRHFRSTESLRVE